ncbi:hypothetical protein [Amycolatopsis anabasis]|uniref:VG15 protein n=1 Tax=Amycolatopsis anabasis TaxID=1840409 RepID=UPI00131E7C0F|nr:hypothetical protein [Amycolatopsis anabasis]
MELEEYSAQQQAITAALVAFILRVFSPYRYASLSKVGWLSLLRFVYPQVEHARMQAAILGRKFYDAQRAQHTNEAGRHDSLLPSYKFAWFVEDMEPERAAMMKPGASESAVSRVGLRAAKVVENGGRRSVLRAVETDPFTVRWARVATGRETCAFCLALISRGPVYLSADTAGLDLDDTSATQLFQRSLGIGESARLAAKELDESMTEWHTGCDCKAVPVFDRTNWPGRDEWKRAESVWIKYSKLVDNDPELLNPQNGNQHTKGKRSWSRSEAIIAAMRRGIEQGDLDMRDYAAAA